MKSLQFSIVFLVLAVFSRVHSRNLETRDLPIDMSSPEGRMQFLEMVGGKLPGHPNLYFPQKRSGFEVRKHHAGHDGYETGQQYASPMDMLMGMML